MNYDEWKTTPPDTLPLNNCKLCPCPFAEKPEAVMFITDEMGNEDSRDCDCDCHLEYEEEYSPDDESRIVVS